MDYPEKIVLHIPQRTWNDGLLKVVDYQQFEGRLAQALSAYGVKGYYISTVTAYYEERSYQEDLLTVYCEAGTSMDISLLLVDTYERYNDIMQQESVAFEQGGALHVIPLT